MGRYVLPDAADSYETGYFLVRACTFNSRSNGLKVKVDLIPIVKSLGKVAVHSTHKRVEDNVQKPACKK